MLQPALALQRPPGNKDQVMADLLTTHHTYKTKWSLLRSSLKLVFRTGFTVKHWSCV